VCWRCVVPGHDIQHRLWWALCPGIEEPDARDTAANHHEHLHVFFASVGKLQGKEGLGGHMCKSKWEVRNL
jgi:hypothetical protein